MGVRESCVPASVFSMLSFFGGVGRSRRLGNRGESMKEYFGYRENEQLGILVYFAVLNSADCLFEICGHGFKMRTLEGCTLFLIHF